MKKILAKHAGFCWGVKRVVKLTKNALQQKEGQVFSYGPLIHNNSVIDKFKAQGLKILEEKSSFEIPNDATVIIRAHGVGPLEKEQFSSVNMIDGTCPHVIKIQEKVAMDFAAGRNIVILGDQGHAEVSGLMGYCPEHGIVISKLSDLSTAKLLEPLTVVCQSTLDLKTFQEVTTRLRKNYQDLEIFDTRCDATEKRQKAALELAKDVDVMVVIGCKNSANTMRLVHICQELNVRTIHLENIDQIEPQDFENVAVVGITAGASTPDWLIEQIIASI